MTDLIRKFRSRRKRFQKWFLAWSRLESWPKNLYFRLSTRLFLLLALTGLSLVLTSSRRAYNPFFDIREGSVADRDIIAPFDFPVYKNESELAQERAAAAAAVRPVIEYLPEVRETVVSDLLAFFDKIQKLRKTSAVAKQIVSWDKFVKRSGQQQARFTIKPVVLNELYAIDSLLSLSDEEIVYLLDPVRSNLVRNRLKDFLSTRLRDGVISDEALKRITNQEVLVRRESEEKVLVRGELLSVERVQEQAMSLVVDPDYPEVSKSLLIQTLRRFLKLDLIYNLTETDRQRQLAAAAVKLTRDEIVLEEEKIIGRGERITLRQMERLQNLKAELEKRQLLSGERNQLRRELGISLVYLSILFSLGLYLFLYHREVYEKYSSLLIIALSFVLVQTIAWYVLGSEELPSYLVPVVIASILISYLLDDQIALASTFCLALVLAVQANFSISILILALGAGATAAISVRRVESRKGQYVPIIYISAVYLLILFALDYGYRGEELQSVMVAAGWCGVNATVSTFITIALLPLFESLFKITSNFTLLELGDLNRPLLKRLALEAPGTYHHSIIIGSLAEAAAAGIGANPVYARVASYYHDIGKIKQPLYFIENQSGRPNPHDKLNPKMSSLIISNHVKEGVELARRARLPECIIDVIRQHHGDQSISFFYSKEKEQNPGTTLREGDFCYPGPRPMTREAAIIMIADAAESAARTLSEPSVNRIRTLIKSLIEAKLQDGQLDNVELTLRDIHRIREEFVNILIGVHHSRIDYPPKQEKARDASQTAVEAEAPVEPDDQDNPRSALYSAEKDDSRNSQGSRSG
ncbi:MAG: HDIG domain-containing metalloprotein [Candidatus Glassbacteria bacterium]